MNTQYRKNLKAVLEASKTYCDESIDSLRWELGTYDLSVDTINGTTMLLPTPTNTIQATMVRVDGASEVSENLIVLNDKAETTTNGITYSVKDGVITINGTCETTQFKLSFAFANSILGGTYSANLFNSGTMSSTNNWAFGDNTNDAYILILTSRNNFTTASGHNLNYLWRTINIGDTFTNYTITPMLVKGSTAPTEFKVGFTGIHNLELSELKVDGQNVFPNNSFTDDTKQGITATKQSDGTIKLNGTATGYPTFNMGSIELEAGTYYVPSLNETSLYYWVGTTSGGRDILNQPAYQRFSFTLAQKTTAYFSFTLVSGSNWNNYIFKPVCIRGKSDITTDDYTTYVAPTTKAIDLSTILYNGNPLFDNGLLGYDDVADSITPYKATKNRQQYAITNATEITQSQEDSGNGIGARIIVPSNVKINSAVLSNLQNYSQIIYDSFYTNQNIGFSVHNTTDINYIYIRLGAEYDTTQKVKDYLVNNSAIFNYELATPIEVNIDFSQLVNFEAHSNGSITLVNTNNQDTTSTIKYLKEVAK